MKDWIITKKLPLEVMKDIANNPAQEEPFYLLDIGDLVRKVDTWRRLMPRVELFYAVKCNDHIAVLETLAALGTGFDCASKVEMQNVISLGVSPSQIIFAHSCKHISYLKYTSRMQISLMTFDCEEELHKIKTHYPQAQLVLRIRCDSLNPIVALGKKFGADVADCRPLLSLAKDLHFQVVGVSFHVGSGCNETAAFQRAIAAARQVFDEAEELGMKPYILDIGGGINGRHDDKLDDFASVINASIARYFPHKDGLKIIAEPGRYVVTSAFSLATSIMGNKLIIENNKTTAMYYIDDGIYGSFTRHLFEDEPFSPKVLLAKGNEGKEETVTNSKVWGPTCCSHDLIKKNFNLPRLDCSDWIYWIDMGAYTLSMASQFNGFPSPKVHAMVSPQIALRLQANKQKTKLKKEEEEL